MPRNRPWFRTLIEKLRGSENPDEKLEEMIEESPDAENVFGLGVSASELMAVVKAMRKDLGELRVQVKNHLQRYQKHLRASERATGIAATDHSIDAQAELNDAQDKHSEYNSLANKYQVLRRALKKWQRIQRRQKRQREYNVDLAELDITAARSRIEELEQAGQIEQQNAERLRTELDMLGGSAEPDTADVDKDLKELEEDRLSESTNDDWDYNSVEADDKEHEDEKLGEDLETDDPLTLEDLDDML